MSSGPNCLSDRGRLKMAKKRAPTKPATYPRDLVGYGRRLPDPKWPGDARIALQISLNSEAGGELNLLHGDKVSEAMLTVLQPR
jgi:hypothetical protein